MWLETLMALIGEQFDESEEICGVVASVRQRQDKVSLWTKTASNEAVQVNIGKKWKEIIDFNDKMVYSFHMTPGERNQTEAEDTAYRCATRAHGGTRNWEVGFGVLPR